MKHPNKPCAPKVSLDRIGKTMENWVDKRKNYIIWKTMEKKNYEKL